MTTDQELLSLRKTMSRLCEKIEKLNDRLLLMELIEDYLRKQIGLAEDLFSVVEKEKDHASQSQLPVPEMPSAD